MLQWVLVRRIMRTAMCKSQHISYTYYNKKIYKISLKNDARATLLQQPSLRNFSFAQFLAPSSELKVNLP